ncbi:cyclin-dependent kinase inhibitor far1 [Podila epigama]|nr:cyclin-dependent kinase inhibitor far1 [Podila epigama]
MSTQNKYGPATAMEFYAENNVIFLTGATGFVGKTILEKVLRSLPMVKKVYILVRVSGTQTLQERVDKEIIASRIFDTLKNQFASPQEFHKQIAQKIVPVKGDITLDRLGLSDEDLEMIQNDTRIVINSAASVSFNDPSNDALEMNTRGPFRTIEVAKGIKNLGAFVHISTAYVNSHLQDCVLSETIYSHPLGNPVNLYKNLCNMSNAELHEYERSVVLKTYPNTYTFTKSLTEHLIQHNYQDLELPINIVRPSVVTAALAEPIPGWAEGVAAANGAIIACALGFVQEWPGHIDKSPDFVPVDFVTKTVLLAATTANRSHSGPRIYHIGTSCINPVSWHIFGTSVTSYWRTVQRPRGRVSDEIRFELFPLPEFKRRFEIRFGAKIRALNDPRLKDCQKAKRARALLAKARAIPLNLRD